MSEPFLGQVMMVGFNFAPRKWAFCDGQILPINQNQSLYSLIGTTYGGDGRTSFALPDMRSRTPFHRGDAFVLGSKTGIESVTLTAAEMPNHTHQAIAEDTLATTTDANNAYLAELEDSGPRDLYASPTGSGLVNFRSGSISNTGGGQAHENMQPYITLSFVIALQGLFPSRN